MTKIKGITLPYITAHPSEITRLRAYPFDKNGLRRLKLRLIQLHDSGELLGQNVFLIKNHNNHQNFSDFLNRYEIVEYTPQTVKEIKLYTEFVDLEFRSKLQNLKAAKKTVKQKLDIANHLEILWQEEYGFIESLITPLYNNVINQLRDFDSNLKSILNIKYTESDLQKEMQTLSLSEDLIKTISILKTKYTEKFEAQQEANKKRLQNIKNKKKSNKNSDESILRNLVIEQIAAKGGMYSTLIFFDYFTTEQLKDMLSTIKVQTEFAKNPNKENFSFGIKLDEDKSRLIYSITIA